MKKTMKGQVVKKLELNKQTIDNLTGSELKGIKAGKALNDPCWDNLWTLYHCNVIFSGEPQQTEQMGNAFGRSKNC